MKRWGMILNQVYVLQTETDNVAKVGHLLELPGAEERLTLFKAHLLDDEALEKVFDGVDCVFHTASPVTLEQVPDVEVIPTFWLFLKWFGFFLDLLSLEAECVKHAGFLDQPRMIPLS